jgi:succinoglycan biosynthesis protein ExoO
MLMQPLHPPISGTPHLSVLMANYQAGEKIVPALRSVLGQSMGELEVIVIDDASGDDTLTHVRDMMSADARIRLVANPLNRGPAHCRNQAIAAARGEWIAIVDSDDIIHPERFERLLALAGQSRAGIVADDLLLFHEDKSPPRLMLGGQRRGSFTVSPRDWVLGGLDGTPALGYLKPVIRSDLLRDTRYDESLRIGEDYDFVLRLLLRGAHMVVVPEPFYLYRRHSQSISHRLSVADMQAMVVRQDALVARIGSIPTDLAAAFSRRRRVLTSGLSYEQLVASIKNRQAGAALSHVVREPAHLMRLWRSFAEGRSRRLAPEPQGSVARTIRLGRTGTAGADHVVPDYVPVEQEDWSAPRGNLLWQTLAAHARVRCIPLDNAGRYAAGFIPEVRLEEQGAGP